MTTPGQSPFSQEPPSPNYAAESFYGSPFMTAIAGAIFLYFGFAHFAGEWTGPEMHVRVIVALAWLTRIVGIALLLVAGLAAMKVAASILLDAAVSGVAGVGCMLGGAAMAYWGYVDGYLLLIFGAINLHAAWNAWQRWQARRVFAAAMDARPADAGDQDRDLL